MKVQIYILGLIFLVSCSKTGNEEVVGGHTLVVQMYHHTEAVPFGEVYLKEDANDFPGKGKEKYDFKAICDEFGKCSIPGLFAGHHWVSGIGFDGVDSVFGNTSVFIDPKDSDGKSKLILLVSE